VIDFVLTPRAQVAKDTQHIRSSSCLAVVVASRDDRSAWVETGATYERFALQATALGIRNAFINQPLEVRRLRPQLASWLGLRGEHPLLMVRLGYGPEAPFSLRRRLEEVVVTTDRDGGPREHLPAGAEAR
jgi:hypothetical protein